MCICINIIEEPQEPLVAEFFSEDDTTNKDRRKANAPKNKKIARMDPE